MVKKRDLLVQLIFSVILIIIFGFFVANTAQNLHERGIAAGFAFLERPTGFDIIMHLISYSSSSSYWRSFVVGILNTLLLSGLAIIVSTLIGFIVGIARISSNWMVSKLATCYVELFRNIPLLLQVFFWYYVLLHNLPLQQQSINFWGGIFINIRGIYLPFGDILIIPELMAMLLALSLYSASYISENIRSGILSVDSGQNEAALALGLQKSTILRLIIVPQALRVIIPPLTSQYLNVTKNSSLGAAIGYPDLVAVFAGTALNQTGQAIETIFMTMSVYLCISLSISVLMNWYNNKYALVGSA